MLGTLVNTGAVIIGGLVGLIFKKGFNEKVSDTVMKGLGLCVFLIGLTGCLKGENILITIISIAVGAVIGALIDLDKRLNNLGERIENRFNKGEKKVSIAQGFVTSSLLFCVGAMAIVGSLNSGLTGDHTTLFTKSLLDMIAAAIFASTLGVGVMLSAVAVLVYQGAITLLAQVISPFMTQVVINEMTCVGSLLIVALSFNMLKITNIKVMNYTPALILPVFLCMIM